ncbi:WW domain-containing protein [Striga asiatica]|uniref:WW domain-containing protein n=1 Tax=Striga asiatica TaxID=4170 RepID=A0A5A7QBW0_STRAF|nr:WW domain-containing protein [Striga asiatica]
MVNDQTLASAGLVNLLLPWLPPPPSSALPPSSPPPPPPSASSTAALPPPPPQINPSSAISILSWTSSTNTARFSFCSVYSGHNNIGTLVLTATCGAHDITSKLSNSVDSRSSSSATTSDGGNGSRPENLRSVSLMSLKLTTVAPPFLMEVIILRKNAVAATRRVLDF